MSKITLSTKINVLEDVIEFASKVGAYQARHWLETHVIYLRIEEHDETLRARTANPRCDCP